MPLYKNKISFLTLLFFISTATFAQQVDTLEAGKYANLGEQEYKNKSFDKSLTYWQKASKLYEEGKYWEKYVNALNRIGKLQQHLDDFTDAADTYKLAIEMGEKYLEENNLQIANAYNGIGQYFNFSSMQKEAIFYAEKALSIKRNILEEKHLLQDYFLLGLYYINYGDFDKSLFYTLKYFTLLDEINLKLEDKEEKQIAVYPMLIAAYHYKNDKENFLKCQKELAKLRIKYPRKSGNFYIRPEDALNSMIEENKDKKIWNIFPVYYNLCN